MSESPTQATDATTPAVRTGRWILDPTRSSFALRHKTLWGLVTVKGTFADLAGEGEVQPDGTARGALTIAASSLDTGHAKRDVHLRSADFFDTEEHPAIGYTARHAEIDARGKVEVTGELTVRGVTQPLNVAADIARAGDAVTLSAETTVDRAAFGLTWNKLGMLTGRTTVTVTAHFTPASS
ncbi:YceI family protein [Streptomyces polygonati]|uniref:YceI family protein n=1 Tax=Streptomyces polygonati TaxID=1617087 RepID=A0ABV8HVW7_9ACTN